MWFGKRTKFWKSNIYYIFEVRQFILFFFFSANDQLVLITFNICWNSYFKCS